MPLFGANRYREQYATFGWRVIADDDADYQGPLAGIVRILEHADTPYVLIVPCDTPFLPDSLVQRLAEALYVSGCDAAAARSADGVQPLCVLLSRRVAPNLRDYLTTGGRKAADWLAQLKLAIVDFSESPGAFYNINTPHELSAAGVVANQAQPMGIEHVGDGL